MALAVPDHFRGFREVMAPPERPTYCSRRRPGLLFALAGLLAAACGEADGTGPTLEGVPALTAEAEMRIDGHEEVLVPIGWMGVAGDGTIALLQSQDAQVRFFDPEGNPIGTAGGAGEGPGEFMRPVRAGWRADSLWVSDLGLGRISVFTPRREFARTRSHATAAEPGPEDAGRLPVFPFVAPYALHPGDTTLMSGQWAANDPLGDRMEGVPVLLRVSPDGTIDRVVEQVPRSEGTISVTYEGGMAQAPVPFYPRPLWVVSPDGSRIAVLTTHTAGPEEGTLRLRVVDARGEEIADRSIPFEPVSIPRQVADSAIRVSAERAPRPDLARAIEREARERMTEVYPPASVLLFGSDHRIWLGLRPTEEGRPWLVLDPDGSPAGRLLLPPEQTIRVADADHVWVTERDDLGVESVVRLRVRVE